MNVYVAGGLKSSGNRLYLEQVAAIVEGAGYSVFLPHRDGILPGKDGPDKGLLTHDNLELGKMVFEGTLEELRSSDLVVAVLDGLCWGTTLELGYAYAYKQVAKRSLVIIGIYTNPVEDLDLMRRNACDHLLKDEKYLPDVLALYIGNLPK